MQDFYLTEDGDLAISHRGDIEVTPTPWRNYSQQAYIRIMTPVSDFTMYPTLGSELDQLIGMPQTAETGAYGKTLIRNALLRDGFFTGIPIEVNAVPVSLQAIRFDIYITAGSRNELILSIEQNLGIE